MWVADGEMGLRTMPKFKEVLGYNHRTRWTEGTSQQRALWMSWEGDIMSGGFYVTLLPTKNKCFTLFIIILHIEKYIKA